MASSEEPTQDQKNGNFICGVVEGFYGRPWTTEQRKELFRKLKKWGMDSYVYAPKDDYKHRAYWRELYTVEEADHLTSLITAAKEQNIVFYYALSPGLDINYSNPKEILALKRKLEQVSQFGCEAFALLFDDIESELSKTDKEAFQTFANAQVSVTNEIFNHLNNPRFLFCPTQYCSSRAVPSVNQSEYLNTLGLKLSSEIDILWTGSKVISKNFTIESIQEITEVLRRAPVIWDNLHANDYDQKRVFLGPYSGRSPELIPLLRGVLTNPNCEFHANTIAIYTLAYWSKCSLDTKINNSISADIKLETENDEGISSEDPPSCLPKNIYHPKVALKNAILEWLPEFSVEKQAWGPITKPQPQVTMVMPIIPIIPSVNTCMSLTTTTTTTCNMTKAKMPEVNTTQLQALAEVCSTVTVTSSTPLPTAMMNSLVSPTKVITNDTIPNPIASAVSNIEMPKKIPISSAPVPVMNVKGENTKTSDRIENCNDNESIIKEDKQETANDDKIIENKKNYSQLIEVPEKSVLELEDKIDNEFVEEDIAIADVSANETKKSLFPNYMGQELQEMESFPQGQLNNAPSLSLNEPMECGSSVNSQASPKNTTKSPSDDIVMSETISTCSAGMQVESSESSLVSNTDMCDEFEKTMNSLMTEDDLFLLCDLFYLPFEHGSRGVQLLNEFYWLKSNATVLLHTSKKNENVPPEVQEWLRRSEKFTKLCQDILGLCKKVASCANRELSYDLFSYIWDINGAISLLNAFIKWLSLGNFPSNISSYTQGSYTWFSKGWKETFMSGDQEPWIFRGGLTADLQRLMPVDSGNDLFLYKLPDTPTTNFFTIRPYTLMDEEQVYKLCLKTYKDGCPCTDEFPDNLKNILADYSVGAFLTICPEFCMIAQNYSNIAGFACATLDSRNFYRNQEVCWIPSMCQKYPLSLLDTPNLPASGKEALNHFHNFKHDSPAEIMNTHPSLIKVNVLKEESNQDQSMAKRLVTVLMAALRSNGSFGVHACIHQNENDLIQFYTKLGFVEIYRDTVNSLWYMGRSF